MQFLENKTGETTAAAYLVYILVSMKIQIVFGKLVLVPYLLLTIMV